jgi:hypothetical protein
LFTLQMQPGLVAEDQSLVLPNRPPLQPN